MNRIPYVLASTLAYLVSLRRPSVQPAVCWPVSGASWWRLDAWIDGQDGPESCLNVDLLGHHIEVYWIRAAVVTA